MSGVWSQGELERLARLAEHLLAMPIAAVRVLENGRPAADLRDRAAALCRRLHDAAGTDAIDDLVAHAAARDDPEVAALGAASYLAAPVADAGGAVVGTLCVLGGEPRRWSAADRQRVADLAAATARAGAPGARPALADEDDEAIDEGDRRWRDVLREAPMLVIVLRGPEHRVEYVNQTVSRLFGHRDYVGRGLRDVAPELAAQGLVGIYDRVYATGQPFRASELAVRIDRGDCPVDAFFNVVCQPLREEGRIDGVLTVGVDITDQVRDRQEAVRAAGRLGRLQRVGTAIATALTPEEVGDAVVREILDSLGAAAGIVTALEQEEGAIVTAVGYPDELVDELRRFPLDAPIPLATALREGTPLWLESAADWKGRWPAPTAGLGAVGAAVPLSVEGRVIGAIGMRFDAEIHAFEASERDFVLALARLCAQAMERARLYAAERGARAAAERAEQRARLLAEVSLAVDAPVGVEERLKSLARLVVPQIGDYCTVRVAEAGGEARLAATAHVEPTKDALVRSLYGRHYSPDARVGPAEVIRTGRPGLIAEVTPAMWRAYAPDEEFLETIQQLEPLSYLCVPLVARGRVLGALSVMTAESGRRFGEEDLKLVAEIGRRAGLSLDNARLYEAERTVATTLQEALLPEGLPAVPGLELARRYVVSSEPGRVGGDWYDAIALEDGRLVICVGDVVGRGPQAAAVMGQLRAALNVLVREGLPPEAVLDRLSRVAETIRGARTTTAAICSLESDRDEFSYACAGHLPPVLVPRAGDARLLWEGRSPPLGVQGGPPRTSGRASLGPGDALLLYTDGLVERRGESLDPGLERLARAASERAGHGPRALCAHVLERLLPQGASDDDVALLAVRRAGVSGPPLDVTFPAQAAELAGLRAALRSWLAAADVDGQEEGDIVLASGEAAANAVEHAYRGSAPGDVTVVASVDAEGMLELEVRDRGRWRSEPAPGDRGRGIPLMRALMDDVELSTGPGGSTVRMRRRLRRPAEADGTAALPAGPRAVAAEPSPARLLDLTREAVGGSVRVSARLAGEIDHASAGPLARRLQEAVGRDYQLLLDLSGVEHLDSAGVRMITELAARMSRPGRGGLRLVVGVGTAPARVLDLAGVAGLEGVALEEVAGPSPV